MRRHRLHALVAAVMMVLARWLRIRLAFRRQRDHRDRDPGNSTHRGFCLGAGAFPQNAAYNPTDTVCALAYFNVDNVIKKYIKNPGPMA